MNMFYIIFLNYFIFSLCEILTNNSNSHNYKNRFFNDSACDIQWNEITTNYDKYFQSKY